MTIGFAVLFVFALSFWATLWRVIGKVSDKLAGKTRSIVKETDRN